MLYNISINEFSELIPEFSLISDIDNRGLILDIDYKIILAIVMHYKPQSAFEIGTFSGGTTSMLAENIDKVYTIDVDKDDFDINSLTKEQYGEVLPRDFVGSIYKNKNLNNVIQFFGDFNKIETVRSVRNCIKNKIGLVFIDGNHKKDSVISNTLSILSMLDYNGVVIWHDVKDGIGVLNAINSISKQIDIYRITDSWIAYHVNKSY